MDEAHQNLQNKWKTRAFAGIAVISLCIIVGVVIYVFGILWQAVATVIVTALIAFMLHGTVNYFVKRGLSRSLAAGLTILIFLAIIAGFFALFVPALVEQVVALSANAPDYINESSNSVAAWLAGLPVDQSFMSNMLSEISAWTEKEAGALLQTAAGGIVSGVTGVGNGLLIFSIALICAFWVLADLPTISRELMSLFDEEQQGNIRVVTTAFSTAVYGWARATLICAIIVGLVNGFAFWILQVPYFALLGVLCGVLYFIPYIGSIIAAVIVFLLGLLVSPLIAVIALAINLVVQNVVANILSPRLMMSSVSVHPAVILIAIMVGGALGGIVGMLFSIPIAAAIQGVFVTFFEQRTGKVLATEEGALFRKPKVKYTPTRRKPAPKKDGAKEEPAE